MGSVSKLAIAATLAGAIAGLAGPAVAGCKRMGFLVNDYGKDGPTNDAKSLLDKHIASWAAEQGIEKYTVGKKDVKCDLFLNLIVVDEHTCTASATVCWGNDKMPSGEREASTGDAPKSEPKPKAKKEAAKESKPAEKAAEKPADAKPEEKAAEAKPAEVKAEEPKAAAVESSAPTKVETGALPVGEKSADHEPAPSSEAAVVKVESTPPSAAATPPAHQAATDAAEAAAAAAERAAAAAERAAAAAERAAAALASAGAAAPAMPGAANTAAAASASTPAVPPLAAEGASKP